MLEWLKGIMPEHVHLELKLNLFSPKINQIRIESHESEKRSVLIDGDKLIINDATEEGANIAEEAIKQLPSNMQHNDLALEEEELETLEEINTDIENSTYDKDLKTYRSTVPKSDLRILEVAILIAIRYQNGESIAKQKAQVIARFGPRGRMICNLYSSGYFKTLILPLYKGIARGEIAMDEYLEFYEMVVTESPLAMFVGMGSTKEKIKQILLEKIIYNKSHDVEYLNIHGIGKTNISRIKSLIKDEDVSKHFIDEPLIQQDGKSIKVTIFLEVDEAKV